MAVRTKMTSPRSAGLGRRRITCQTMMLIETILRAGESANEPSKGPKAGGGFHSNDLPMPDCKQSGTAGARSLWFITWFPVVSRQSSVVGKRWALKTEHCGRLTTSHEACLGRHGKFCRCLQAGGGRGCRVFQG